MADDRLYPPYPAGMILLVEVGSTAHGTGLPGGEDHDETAVVVETLGAGSHDEGGKAAEAAAARTGREAGTRMAASSSLRRRPTPAAQGVDIISDPHRQDDGGYNWTRLRFARAVADVLPGSSVVIGSAIGRYPAKVIAWDFEVSDDDPIVTLELLLVTPEVRGAAAADRT